MTIRVVHVVEAYGSGVLEVVNAIANGLPEDFAQVVVYSRRPETPPQPQALLLRARAVPLPMPSKLSPLATMTAAVQLRRLLQTLAPDVVHLHSSMAGGLGRLATAGLDCATLYSPHAYAFLDPAIAPLRRRLYWALEWALARLRPGCQVLACAESERQQALQLGCRALLAENAPQLPAALLMQAYGEVLAQRAMRLQRGHLTVMAVGRLTPMKNPILFAQLAAEAARRKLPWRFVWLGGGTLTACGVEVTGWLPREQALHRLLTEADVLVSTSLHEGLSLAVAEAQMLGLPVLVSSVPSNLEAVAQAPLGRSLPLSAPPARWIEGIDALRAVSTESALRRQADWAQRRFDHARHLQVVASVYRQLVAARLATRQPLAAG